MKNACIVWRKNLISFDDGIQAVLNEFLLNGYAFEEVCTLSQENKKRTKEVLSALKKEYDNVFFFADKTALISAKQQVEELFSGAQIYANFGDAAIYEEKNTTLFLLSADLSETGLGYVKNACVPFLRKKYGLRFDKIVLRTVGANLAHLERLLAEAQRCGGDRISCNHVRKYDEDVIEIVYDSNTPKMLTDDLLRMFAEGLGDTMYALEDVTLEKQLVSLLKLRGKKLSVAESFTGGGVAKRIVSVSGASEVYFEGLNTYNETAKIKRLGVSPYTLGSQGAVSDQTAYEMALGLLNTGDCDVAIATTGLAGPKSDKFGQPVGFCCIAVGTKERICVYQYRFDGDRKEITEKAINYALFLAYKRLKDI